MSSKRKPKPPSKLEDDPLGLRLLYSPHVPHPRQHAFLLLDDMGVEEAFYGGAGGGGKSDALLMAALRYVDVPGYSALILRKTFNELALPGAIMSRAQEWLANTDARWNSQDHRFTFPSGATLSFGYLDKKDDHLRYSGAEFQFIAFDELTHFSEDVYRFMFTRLRKPAEPDNPLSRVPLRMRSASNPGSRGHEWVRRRLVKRQVKEVAEGEEPDPLDTEERAAARVYIPARIVDNPSVDQEAYERQLANADPYVRAQILDGDWDARPPGKWVYDHNHLAAVFALGDDFDQMLLDGTLPPPAGDLLTIGIDWGEHTHALIGWPLVGGGLYVVAEHVTTSGEPGETTAGIIGRPKITVRGNPDPEAEQEIVGVLDTVVEIARRKDDKGRSILPRKGLPLALVRAHHYDAAGIQPMRTYLKLARARHRGARSIAVSFGAAAPVSGRKAAKRSYKAETIGHLRAMARRTAEEKTTGVLAIGGRCPELRRQLPLLLWRDREAGIVEKGDDHGPDALIALDAPQAVKGRSWR